MKAIKKLVCKLFGHKTRPHLASWGSNHAIERCIRCEKYGAMYEKKDVPEEFKEGFEDHLWV